MRVSVTIATEKRMPCCPAMGIADVVHAIREAADRIEAGETEGEMVRRDGIERPVGSFVVTVASSPVQPSALMNDKLDFTRHRFKGGL